MRFAAPPEKSSGSGLKENEGGLSKVGGKKIRTRKKNIDFLTRPVTYGRCLSSWTSVVHIKANWYADLTPCVPLVQRMGACSVHCYTKESLYRV